ncbi:hypothetical protein DH2020_020630 [Rehmannia glutinosa]|uniref:Retrotransposon Copia-like N-terminal domain-containing protein n=1 Tax=Rehmannia glutinosa TaxID=99300 RepID=A0ABR0WJH6_REHGL
MAHRRNNVWPLLNTTAAVAAAEDEYAEDPLRLYSSDHPGLSLVTSQLTGNNYLSWRRSMLIALGAKTKLGFINGKIEVPEEDSPKYDQWRKVDCMVISWILNSISKDLVDAFIYSNTAKELWDDIAKRFGDCNGPMIYQLERDISNMHQGSLSVVEYFTKLKRLWDELACLMPLPICESETRRLIGERDMNRRLMQFLMGLHESYDQVRSQLLLMDPLPDVDKAYSMVLRVEKQRNVHLIYPDNSESVAMSSRMSTYGRGNGGRGTVLGLSWNGVGRGATQGTGSNVGRGRGFPRRTKEEKAKLTCDYCSMSGHEMSECFKLHGYPDWFKKLKEERTRAMANMVDGELPNSGNSGEKMDTHKVDIAALIKQEVSKILAGQAIQGSRNTENTLDYAHFTDFAGTDVYNSNHYALTTLEILEKDSWILDTGASRHMCSSSTLMTNIVPITSSVSVCLPDGATKLVTHSGQLIDHIEAYIKKQTEVNSEIYPNILNWAPDKP